jgi:O-antigen ligase
MNQRLDRWADAWSKMSDSPLIGSGYGQWLAHNVPLEIGRTIGVIPALVFTGWLVAVVFRTVRLAVVSPSREARRYGSLFLGLAVLWTTQAAIETIFSTPSLAAPHWLLICVTWHVPAIVERERLAMKRFRTTQYTFLAARPEPTIHEPLKT